MATWLVVWFVIALTTMALLLAFTIALVRHGIVLGRTARQMAEEAGPIASDIGRGADHASAHAARLKAPTWGGRSGRRR